VIHRSQDQQVEAHADRILADEASAGALMEFFEAQMREYRRPWHRRLGAAVRRILRAVGSAFGVGGQATRPAKPDDSK
jgi:hypothetical protein